MKACWNESCARVVAIANTGEVRTLTPLPTGTGAKAFQPGGPLGSGSSDGSLELSSVSTGSCPSGSLGTALELRVQGMPAPETVLVQFAGRPPPTAGGDIKSWARGKLGVPSLNGMASWPRSFVRS